MKSEDYNTSYHPTWCPGCGNWGIWQGLKSALVNSNLKPHEVVIVYGIGCSGNMNDFVKTYGLHALHGRAIPNACGIKIANHKLTVICIVGDGDCYGEGGNHLIHAARGNHDIKVFVHDNRIYGLTTGQTSPTSPSGFLSKSTPKGAIELPLNPLSLAISQGGTFVAQGFAGDIPHLANLMSKAIKHQGFSLLNILQPCVTFNKICTYKFYQERIYKLPRTKSSRYSRPSGSTSLFSGENKLEEKGWSSQDKLLALRKASLSSNKIPAGVFYQEKRPSYHEKISQIKKKPLVEQKLKINVNSLFKEFI